MAMSLFPEFKGPADTSSCKLKCVAGKVILQDKGWCDCSRANECSTWNNAEKQAQNQAKEQLDEHLKTCKRCRVIYEGRIWDFCEIGLELSTKAISVPLTPQQPHEDQLGLL
jgi:hypothetical protein